MTNEAVLAGKLVLDLSRLLPGPYCSMILADYGARVITIEDRRFKREFPLETYMVNRNKEHMNINLKTDKGREIFYRLTEKADVIIEGFRPGVTKRLGVDYETLKNINKRIIYCSITGYGQSGPYRDKVGHDVNYLGYAGALSLIGEKEGIPAIPVFQVADIVGGGMNAAIGILLAIIAREQIGEGQYIDISMVDGVIALLTIPVSTYLLSGEVPKRSNHRLSHRYACYNVYETKDGKFISIGAVEHRFWENICDYFNVPQYKIHQYDEKKRKEITDFFRRIFRKKTRKEWSEIFSEIDTCFGEVLEINELIDSKLVKDRKMIVAITDPARGKMQVINTAIKMSSTPGSARTCPPRFGQDTSNILKELGYDERQVLQFQKTGII